jgi:UDP-N-acetylmuramoylalanine--D-glutamate ligase
MNKGIEKVLEGKRILILGFGKEGISTYKLLIQTIPPYLIAIADQDENVLKKSDFKIHPKCGLLLGKNYLEKLDDFDLIIKSPGISNILLNGKTDQTKVTSQTELFLKVFDEQTIGVTGTKGKSTTSSLIKHVLSQHYKDVVLIGNIGIPPFDIIEQIGKESWIVFEISSHQLENISVSPFIAVLLNFYEEHLDHYESYKKYQLAKLNITKFQSENNFLIINGDDKVLNELYQRSNLKRKLLTFSLSKESDSGVYLFKSGEILFQYQNQKSKFNFSGRQYLPGNHNLMNIMAAVCACKVMEVPDDIIQKSILEFKGLKHRMEFVGKFKGIYFYNDSISTIPQATIQAVKSLKKVDTLILGGKDRGIDYQPLIEFLPVSGVRNLIFIGAAGWRIQDGLESLNKPTGQNIFLIKSYDEIPFIIRNNTKPGYICLLSPAASSYDMFKNFEERGDVFKKIAENI